ncbi:MAG: PepSY domain-containing protein [Planctomycetes bacterium]|nr:PepSY domain-containing protein [Planctomycetota bacterium]
MSTSTFVTTLATLTLLGGRLATEPVGPSDSLLVRARHDGRHVDVRDLVAEVKVSLAQAVAVALETSPGKVVEAELEGEREDGKVDVFYEVMIVGIGGSLHEVKVDPHSGRVRSTEDATEKEGGGSELAEFQQILRHCELDVGGILKKAEAIVRGIPAKVELGWEDGQPVFEVQVVNGRYLIDAELEARAGHLIELELESIQESRENEGDDGGDDEGDGEDREQEGGEDEDEGHR